MACCCGCGGEGEAESTTDALIAEDGDSRPSSSLSKLSAASPSEGFSLRTPATALCTSDASGPSCEGVAIGVLDRFPAGTGASLSMPAVIGEERCLRFRVVVAVVQVLVEELVAKGGCSIWLATRGSEYGRMNKLTSSASNGNKHCRKRGRRKSRFLDEKKSASVKKQSFTNSINGTNTKHRLDSPGVCSGRSPLCFFLNIK